MQIYLLRHAIAEDSTPGHRDAERALIPDGKKRLRAVLKRMKAAGVAPTLILTSPYRRALQSAEIAASVLGYEGEILRTNALEPGSSPQAVWEEVRLHRDHAALLLSGHEPLFSALAAALLNAPGLQIDFKKGAAIRIDLESVGLRPRGVLKWMLTTRLAGAD